MGDSPAPKLASLGLTLMTCEMILTRRSGDCDRPQTSAAVPTTPFPRCKIILESLSPALGRPPATPFAHSRGWMQRHFQVWEGICPGRKKQQNQREQLNLHFYLKTELCPRFLKTLENTKNGHESLVVLGSQ